MDRTTPPAAPPALGEALRRGGARPEERAIRVAIACSIFGGLAKLVAGSVTGSMAMISSAIDSLGDLFVSMANLAVFRYGQAPPDEEHNYGHAKIEGLGAMFEGGFIFAAGLFIIYEAIRKALIGDRSHDSLLGIAVMVPVLGATIGTVSFLRKIARETGSLVVKADAVHYLTDVWVNVGVLVSLVLVKITGRPIVDTVISVGIALYMLYSSIAVLREGFDVVMDKSLDREVVDRIVKMLHACARIESFHELKTRRGKTPHVDFHAVVRPEMTTREVHDLFLELRAGIRGIAGEDTMVFMHADPSPDA
jgi:ferrous-iron efflux pump FieF